MNADRIWNTFEARRRPFYRDAYTGAMKQFAREEALVLHALKHMRHPEMVVESVANRNAWQEYLQQTFTATGAYFADVTLHKLEEKSLSKWYRGLNDYYNRFGAKRVSEITSTTRAEVANVIRDGVLGKKSNLQIAVDIRRVYQGFTGYRALTISRTEVAAASNFGGQLAIRMYSSAKQVGFEKRWVSTPDKKTRAWHRAAYGQARPLHRAYIVGGEKLMFPGDWSMGASARNIVNCRCIEIYVENLSVTPITAALAEAYDFTLAEA